jgi:hypothetical protein
MARDCDVWPMQRSREDGRAGTPGPWVEEHRGPRRWSLAVSGRPPNDAGGRGTGGRGVGGREIRPSGPRRHSLRSARGTPRPSCDRVSVATPKAANTEGPGRGWPTGSRAKEPRTGASRAVSAGRGSPGPRGKEDPAERNKNSPVSRAPVSGAEPPAMGNPRPEGQEKTRAPLAGARSMAASGQGVPHNTLHATRATVPLLPGLTNCTRRTDCNRDCLLPARPFPYRRVSPYCS